MFVRTCFCSAAVPHSKFKLSSGNISLALQSACVTWWTHPTTTRAVRAAVNLIISGWNCFENPLQMRKRNVHLCCLSLLESLSVVLLIGVISNSWRFSWANLLKFTIIQFVLCLFLFVCVFFSTTVTIFCVSTVCQQLFPLFFVQDCNVCHYNSFLEFKWYCSERIIIKNTQSVLYWHLSSVVKSHVDGREKVRSHMTYMTFMSPHSSVLRFQCYNRLTDGDF